MTGRQTQQQHSAKKGEAAEAEAPAASTDTSESDRLKAELDAVLDDIEEVLAENAEEMVANYVQRGGE